MSNFFEKPAFGGRGYVSGFRDEPFHASTFKNGLGNHLTLNGTSNHDFTSGLRDFHAMGGLEKRVSILHTWNNSTLNTGKMSS